MILYLARKYIAMPVGLAFSVAASILFAALPDFSVAIAMPALVAVARAIPQRPTRFEAALPIRGRELVIARILSTLVLVLVPLMVWMLASVAYGHRWSLTAQLEIVAIVMLAVVVPYTVATDQIAPRVWIVLAPWVGLAAFAALVLYVLTPLYGLAVFALALPGAAWFAWNGMPESFQISPLASAPARGTAPRFTYLGSMWWLPILRSAWSPITMMFIALTLFDAALGSWLMMLIIGLAAGYEAVRRRMLWMIALPLSHRARLLLVLTPTVFAFVASIGIGRRIGDPFTRRGAMDAGAPSTPYGPGPFFENRTRVSLEYWKRVAGRDLPQIAAPWGETTPPDTMTVLGMLLYNPYSSDRHSSERFVEWQFERATTAVYGRPITRIEYDRGRPLPPTMTDGWRMFTLSAAALIIFGLAGAFMLELGRWHEFTRPGRYSVAVAVALGLSINSVVFVEFYYGIRRTGHYILPLAESFLMQVSRELPSSFAAVLAAAAIPVFLAYALLERQFSLAEAARTKVARK